MIISGIYRIRSKVHPDRIYIGSAVYIHDRWYRHRQKLRKNKHENSKLQNHYNKYGLEDLSFDILFLCKVSELSEAEQYLIDSYDPWFNICKIVGTQQGRHWKVSDIGRANMSKCKIGNKNNLGKKRLTKRVVSEETKIKISIGTKKAMADPELRKKLSILKKGQKGPMTGKTHSKEVMDKIIAKISKPILQFTKNGLFLKEWSSIKQAARELSLHDSNIIACAKHKARSCGGFLWEYKLKEEQA